MATRAGCRATPGTVCWVTRPRACTDLEITNVTLEDDGRFQCQVSPSGGQPAIRADAYLSVILKPQSVRLRAFVDGVATYDEVQVPRGESVTLTCDVTGARPAAGIEWQRNGRHLEADGSAAVLAAVGDARRLDTRSSLTVDAGRADDGAGYSCVARHPALRPADGHRERFNASITFSVLYPPGPPSISGYSAGEILRTGEQRTLTCSSEGGNPPARLVWTRNGRAVGQVYRAGRRAATAAHMFIADPTDLGVRLPVHGLLQIAPKRVSVTAPASAQSGDVIHVSCVTSESNPPANLTWIVSDGVLENNNMFNDRWEATWAAHPAPDGGWISSSNVTALVPADADQQFPLRCFAQNPAVPQPRRRGARHRSAAEDNGRRLTCRSRSDAADRPSDASATLRVSYAPVFERPQLNATAVRGQPLSLNVTARANPPVRDYVWSRADGAGASADGRLLTSADGRLLTSADGVLNLTSVRRDDAGWYLLRATSALGSASARVHVDVLYPPKVFKTPSIITAARHGRLDLPCRAEANPLSGSMFSWSRPGQRQPLNLTSSYLNGTSFLRIPALTEDSAGDFVCSVTNDLGLDSATFTVVIQEPAKIAKSVRFAKAAARLGEKAHVTCRARGAPAVTFSWSRDGDVISGTGSGGKYGTERKQIDVLRWASVLVISDITESDYGEYECRASNRLGSDTHRVRLVEPSAPDPPRDLHVLNVSSGAVTLAWTPAFDGGFIQLRT
ncbi:Nephrin [Amphibalanus amphitrite]|uniref:Nephrin n=1 Tax=Amphibalanus amphitrite TaxID=1232801 RepID=A0A6A4WR55_AMPAM|nr:Nephrin [Amphibalanus amphitrite]